MSTSASHDLAATNKEKNPSVLMVSPRNDEDGEADVKLGPGPFAMRGNRKRPKTKAMPRPLSSSAATAGNVWAAIMGVWGGRRRFEVAMTNRGAHLGPMIQPLARAVLTPGCWCFGLQTELAWKRSLKWTFTGVQSTSCRRRSVRQRAFKRGTDFTSAPDNAQLDPMREGQVGAMLWRMGRE